MAEFDAVLKAKFKQNLPKKIVLSKRIKVSRTYECQVTMWVPDTPYSKFTPGIGVTIRHGKGEGKDSVRLVFGGTEDLKKFLTDLNMFVLDNFEKVGGAFREAIEEWTAGRMKRDDAIESRRKSENFS